VSRQADDEAPTNPTGARAMMALLARARFVVGALAVCFIALGTPASAQQNDVVSPDASVVNEQTLLRQSPRIEGRIDIPNETASVLEQPAGRTWDHFHQVTLHWLTAVSFIVLGLSGLNITFGKALLLPLIGPDAFSAFSQAAKYAHNFMSFPFVLGIVLILVIWIKDNIPDKVDIEWFRQGGGFIKSKHAPARRFNAGEKLVFWGVLGAGALVSVSGFLLLFPFYVTDIAGMQIAQVVHSVIAVLFVALILGHIYIGTLGMEGAFEAMGTGEVDYNWAKEHHDLWLEDELAKSRSGNHPGLPSATPAE